MTSTTSSQKRIEKVSSDNIVIGFDLFSNLAYMASLSAARAPRSENIQKAGQQKELQTSVVFEQVHLLAQRLGIEYTRALQMVAEKTRSKSIKSLLLRFASSIASGESEHVFILEETRIESGRYRNEYEGSLENLKKWTDAYAAMLVSVTLIVVVGMVSTLLGALGNNFIIVVGLSMFFITSGGVYVIFRTAPYEQITYDGATDPPPDRATSKFLLRTLAPMGLLLSLLIGYFFGVGPALIAFGATVYPLGFFAKRDDNKLAEIDQEVPTFIRSLGTIAGTTITTLSTAMNSLDLESMGSLKPHVSRLRTRLRNELSPELSWEKFNTETGNELLRRSTEMLVDGVELGGNGEEVAGIASSYASTVAELRRKRQLVTSSFAFLVLPMHTAMTGLLLFILQIVTTFDQKLADVSMGIGSAAISSATSVTNVPGLEIFKSQDLTLITSMITIVIIILTISNGLATKFASGGHNLKIGAAIGLTSMISGINMIVVPTLASAFLGT